MGFFSKKDSAPKPGAEPIRIKSPSAPAAAKSVAKAQPIAITGLGVACHAGDQPHNLIRSIIGQVSGVRLSEDHQILTDDGSYAIPRMAPVVEFAGQTALGLAVAGMIAGLGLC